MSRFTRTLRVVSNPYSALDHLARPCGIVLVEPERGGGGLGYIGARVDTNQTTIRVAEPGDLRGNVQDTVFRFDGTPVEVKATPYYVDALRTNALLPADEHTAAFAGLKFVPVEQALEATRLKAIETFDGLYGKGSYETLAGAPKSAPAPAAAPPAPLAAPQPSPAPVEPSPEATEPTTKRKADK